MSVSSNNAATCSLKEKVGGWIARRRSKLTGGGIWTRPGHSGGAGGADRRGGGLRREIQKESSPTPLEGRALKPPPYEKPFPPPPFYSKKKKSTPPITSFT